MSELPYVTLSSATSLDGYLDTADPPRLILSNEEDRDRVDAVRAQNDAILVGARTIRRDNPQLLVRSPVRQSRRKAEGLPPSPWKVTVTETGDLDPSAAFFTTGDMPKLVYCPDAVATRIRQRLGHTAHVVGLGARVLMTDLVTDLMGRGIRNLMVEGGTNVHTQFLAANLVDELHFVVAPLFVGDVRAPRFVGDAEFPWTSQQRATLADVRQIGDVVLLRYALSARFTKHDAELQQRLAAPPITTGIS